MSPGRAGPLTIRLLSVCLLSVCFLASGPAAATREPPTYRQSLQTAAAARAEELNAEGHFDEALALCEQQDRAFGHSAAVLYEWAYAYNALDRLDQAVERYGQVISLDPDNASAHYDRAEILLGQGELDGAAADLAVAARLRPDHWAVHFRLAEVAALRSDPAAFEVELMAALSNGLDLRSLGDYPAWQRFMADPAIGPVLQRVITVYGDDDTVQRLKGP